MLHNNMGIIVGKSIYNFKVLSSFTSVLFKLKQPELNQKNFRLPKYFQ